MTDEEMAEVYVKDNCDDSLYSFRGQELQEAFLAGLKADRPKWHKVADGDLPKESIPVIILSSDDSIDECIYIPDAGFKNPVFSTWYFPLAWIEKEKILPKR